MLSSIWYRFYAHCIYIQNYNWCDAHWGRFPQKEISNKFVFSFIFLYLHFLVFTLNGSIHVYHSICFYQCCSTTFGGLSYNNIFLRKILVFLHLNIKCLSHYLRAKNISSQGEFFLLVVYLPCTTYMVCFDINELHWYSFGQYCLGDIPKSWSPKLDFWNLSISPLPISLPFLAEMDKMFKQITKCAFYFVFIPF